MAQSSTKNRTTSFMIPWVLPISLVIFILYIFGKFEGNFLVPFAWLVINAYLPLFIAKNLKEKLDSSNTNYLGKELKLVISLHYSFLLLVHFAQPLIKLTYGSIELMLMSFIVALPLQALIYLTIYLTKDSNYFYRTKDFSSLNKLDSRENAIISKINNDLYHVPRIVQLKVLKGDLSGAATVLAIWFNFTNQKEEFDDILVIQGQIQDLKRHKLLNFIPLKDYFFERNRLRSFLIEKASSLEIEEYSGIFKKSYARKVVSSI